MDRRTLLAIGLMLIVAVLPAILLRPDRQPATTSAPGDTLQPQPRDTTAVAAPAAVPEVAPPPVVTAPSPDTTTEQVISVESPLYRYDFSTRGAHLAGAVLKEYRSFAPGDSGAAQIIPAGSRWLEYSLVIEADTLSLADWSFAPTATELDVTAAGTQLGWVAVRGPLTVELTYTFDPDEYLFDVAGRVRGIESGLVVIRLGPRLAMVDADSVWDIRSYGVVTKARNTERLNFRSLDPAEQRALEGPFEWVAIKSKYFLGAVLALGEGQPQFGGALATGGPRPGNHAVHTDVVTSLPAPGGQFAFSGYFGPQEFRRLSGMGHDLEDVNPYGWIFRPIIMPFANLIVRILLWMHDTLQVGYGWVLIIFGLLVRIVLWPLNQKAMRSSMAMQAIQPELKAVQERYKQDPQRMQQEVMKLYREHGVNPLGGCVPMLIPMPVLFALFFVFRETIEFRGVPFLWLPDLSRPDPLYIIPIFMGLSMFLVMRLGQLGVPPNPQAKMMLYVMPGFLTFIFLKLSAGLNLYYAVSNVASIPQQYLIAKRRLGQRTAKKRE
jgi:YidC/Oxa1 family membrane protein insertase